jgi:N-acetylmuramoyl-L-alanine amidase
VYKGIIKNNKGGIKMAKSIYLSPSTQEKNVGAGDYGTEEFRANQICDITEKELIRHGVKVYRNKPTMTLSKIVADSNKKNADVHFAIHTNAYNKKARGCEIFCYEKGVGSEGEKLANEVYLKIALITPTADRGVKQGKNFYGDGKSMYELENTKMPAALIEVAFHDNPSDAAWIINNIEKIGTEIAKGILKYFNIVYMPIHIDTNTFYRVVAGSYNNKENADKQIENLKNKGISAFIDKIKI